MLDSKTLRRTASPFYLIRKALGGKQELVEKSRRAARTLNRLLDGAEIERRLTSLSERGYIQRRPNRWQLAFGALDMLRFVIVPAARDYYQQQGINFHFHQLLRFLDDPVSVIDPTGLLSERDTVIGHLMQVVHLNPIYDLQLLEMFPDGLSELQRQVEQMVEGTHPRSGTIGAIIEDAGYHQRLLDYVRAFRGGGGAAELIRPSGLRGDPNYAAAERTFASLPGYIEYCNRLPRRLPGLLRRQRRVTRFPLGMAAPEAGA